MKRKTSAESNNVQKKSNYSKSGSKNRNNRNKGLSIGVKVVLSVFIIAILILVYVGFFADNGAPGAEDIDDYLSYNGFIFEKEKSSGLWKTILRTPSGDVETLFHYHPMDLEDIPVDRSINFFLLQSQAKKGNVTVSLSSSFANEGVAAIAGIEISKITSKFFGMDTKSAFISQINGSNFPVIHCGNASRSNFVVQIMRGGDNSVRLGGKYCAILYANTTNDTIRLADRFVYSALGVMRN